VPEHRSKKASKKKTKPVLHLDAKPGALFLARMKGHQPWPSIICDEDMLPAILIQTRPVTAAQADGSFKKEDYADGGRREHERTFPVMFLFTNEFAWIPNTELTTITPEECAEAVGKQKSKTLAGAYNIASEGHDLDHFKQVLLEHQEMLNAEADAKAEREAKKAEKSAKQKRKSDVAASSADDKMDIDEEGKGKTKKRKKEAGADEDEKVNIPYANLSG
jgi:PWWP domain